LRQIFALHGLPCKIVSDNGPTFTSHEFHQFTTENDIQHVFSAPYHPSSNGLAERAVQTFKQALKQMQPEGSLQSRLSRFLFKYNITPHTTTGIAPSELLMGRQLRSRLSLLYPDVASTVDHKQNMQKQGKNNQSPIRRFKEGDLVLVENFTRSGERWLPGTVAKVNGPLSYEVKLLDGSTVRRHVDHVRKRSSPPQDTSHDSGVDSSVDLSFDTPVRLVDNTPIIVPPRDPSPVEVRTVRRSSRVSRPPDRLLNPILH